MTPATSRSVDSDRIDLVLGAIGEIKTMVSQLDGRIRTLESTTVAQGITAAQEIKAIFRKIDEHGVEINQIKIQLEERVSERKIVTDGLDKCIDVQDKRIEKIESVVALLRWVGASLGALIIALIWAILTHTITLTYH